MEYDCSLMSPQSVFLAVWGNQPSHSLSWFTFFRGQLGSLLPSFAKARPVTGVSPQERALREPMPARMDPFINLLLWLLIQNELVRSYSVLGTKRGAEIILETHGHDPLGSLKGLGA